MVRTPNRAARPGHHDLHMIGALAHLLAGGFAHLVDTVGDRGLELQAVAADAFAAAIGAPARIRMSPGRADGLAGDEQPRTRDMPSLDRGLDAPVGPSGVADGGEAAVEHRAQPRRRARGDKRQRQRLHHPDIDLAVDGMDVAVDQARHQGALTAIDHGGIRRLDGRFAQFLDRIAFDQQLIAAAKLAERRLEQLEIPEQDLLGHGRAQCSRFLWKRPPFMITERCRPSS